MALIDNLVGVWCEAAAPTTDESGNGQTLTNNNTVGTTTGVVGTAGTFTAASSQSLTHADNASLSTGDVDFTLQCWLNLTTKTNGDTYICKREAFEFTLNYGSGSDRLRFLFGQNAIAVTANNFGAPPLSTWMLVHCWHDSVNDLIGISVNAGTANTAADTSANAVDGNGSFAIGKDLAFGQYANAKINQVAFWKRVLTSTERTSLYNSGSGLAFASWGGGSTPVGADALHYYREHVMRGGD